MPSPGQVCYLPPEAREGPNKGDRPHLVLSLCDENSEAVTLAYGSTKFTDAANGAAHVLVDPFAKAYRGTGLSQPTYIYPSRLISYPVDQLPEPEGRIIDEMPQIRAALHLALGIGAGVTTEANVPGSNRRGRIVQFAPEITAEIECTHGLVVTEPTYSRSGFQQTLVPIFDAAEFESRDLDVVVTGVDWLARISGSPGSVILAAPLIFSVYGPTHIARYTPVIVDDNTMRQVDTALAIHFGI